MAQVEIAERGKPAKTDEFALRRPKKRVSIHIDMTPMVDVAFLLLIFFMVTTVFRQPLAMEVNMPEPGAKVEVPESNVMTVFIDDTDALSYKVGKEALVPISWEDLTPTFRAYSEANPDLIVLVKIHRSARYENMVDMMDTLEDAHLERFSLVPMATEDEVELDGMK
jgi:biopolymer transport protein ExbD